MIKKITTIVLIVFVIANVIGNIIILSKLFGKDDILGAMIRVPTWTKESGVLVADKNASTTYDFTIGGSLYGTTGSPLAIGSAVSTTGDLTVAGDLDANSFNIQTLSISNATTDNTISIDQNGNVGTTVSTDGAYFLENTDNTGIGLGIYSNMDGDASAPLVYIKADNVAFDQKVLRVDNDGVGNAIYTYQTKATTVHTGAWYLQHPGVLGANQYGFRVYTASNHTGGWVAKIANDSATSAAISLEVQNDGTAPALKIDADNGTHINLVGDTSNSSPSDGDIWYDGEYLKLYDGVTTWNIATSTP